MYPRRWTPVNTKHFTNCTHPALIGVIRLDVLLMPLGQLLYGRLDDLHAPGHPHVRGGEVGVSPGTIPVPDLDISVLPGNWIMTSSKFGG